MLFLFLCLPFCLAIYDYYSVQYLKNLTLSCLAVWSQCTHVSVSCNNYVKGFVLSAFDGMCVHLAVNIHHFVLGSLCACYVSFIHLYFYFTK